MRTLHAACLVVAVLGLASPASSMGLWSLLEPLTQELAQGPQNDAGTGGDASDARSAPTILPDWGSYTGGLKSKDQDWYGVVNTTMLNGGAYCVDAVSTGTTYSNVTLAIKQGSVERSVTTLLAANGTTSLVLAGAGATSATYGIVPVPNPANHDPARPGDYTFDIRGRAPADFPAGDAGTGRDAGNTLARSVAVTASCFAGALMPLGGIGDTKDVYSFNATAGDAIIYSLGSGGGPSVRLTLIDALQQQLVEPITSGGIAWFQFNQTATYYFVVQQDDSTSTLGYIVGLVGPGPGGSPCRPYCAIG